MPSLRAAGRARLAGFTLVEILVSIAVLAILILLVSQLFNSATATATMSRKHIDADEAARLAFDRMGSDFGLMVKRLDVNYIFCKNGSSSTNGSSDAMFFYSECPGYLDPNAGLGASGSASSMALVGYRINPNNTLYSNTPVMERLGENLTWGGPPDTGGAVNPGSMAFLPASIASTWTYTLGSPPYLAAADTTHYQVLSDMVFRMEFCFLLKSGTYAVSGTNFVTSTTGYTNAPTAAVFPSGSSSYPYITSNYFTGGSAPDLAGNVYGLPPDLGAIVVTIAVLDNTSRKIIATGGLSNLAAALGDSLSGVTTLGNSGITQSPQLPAQLWQSQILSLTQSATPPVPKAALAQVRVYERTFYLNAN